MTVSTATNRADYNGNGSVVDFAVPFRFLVNSDVQVILIDSSDVETTQVETTNYTLVGAGNDAGGTVTMLVAPATGERLTVLRDVPTTQETDYVENDSFPAESHEDALDKLTMIVQQQEELLARTLKFTAGSINTDNLSLPVPTVGQFLKWNALLTGLENTGVPAQVIPGTNVGLVSDMKGDSSLQVGDFVFTNGHVSTGDSGDNSYEVVAAATGTDDNGSFIDLPGSGFQAKALFPRGIITVMQFGAVGDGVTDDSIPIQNALNFVKTGGVLVFPPNTYFVDSTIVPQYTGETPLQRHNLVEAGSPTAGPIEDITIQAYGARFLSTDVTFTSTFPFCMLAFVGVDRITVQGLQFESNTNNKVTGWFDSTNYFNQSPPAVAGEFALFFVDFRDVKIQDCVAEHCEGGFILTDDRNSTIPAAETMDSSRSIITGCRVFNCTQGMSMTVGSSEDMIIENNHFEYTFIKLVQESDQGRAIHIKNNTWRDISGILINTNNTQINGNTFNNLLGGFSLQPQGGSDPRIDYDYDLLGMLIADNYCYSDHLTDVISGTAQPQAAVIINASAVNTASQTVTVDGLVIKGNQFELWPVGSASTGAFIQRGGDADIDLLSIDIIDNKVKLNNSTGVIVSLAPNGVATDTNIKGTIEFKGNVIERTAGNANFEFQFWSGTFNAESLLRFNDNNITTNGTNRMVTMGNIGKLESKGNKFISADPVGSTSSTYWIASVPLVDINNNDIVHLSPTDNVGFIVYFDGNTTTVYDTVLDEAVYRIKDNRITDAAFVFSSAVTFPASAKGFYDLMGNVIRDNTTPAFQTYPALTGFDSENVVNPSKTNPPPSIDLTPGWYVVWHHSSTATDPTGWIWDGTWNPLGTH